MNKHGLRFFIRLVVVERWQGGMVAGGKLTRWQEQGGDKVAGGKDKVVDNRLEKHLQKDTAAVL